MFTFGFTRLLVGKWFLPLIFCRKIEGFQKLVKWFWKLVKLLFCYIQKKQAKFSPFTSPNYPTSFLKNFKLLHAVCFSQFYKFICYGNLPFRFFPTGNIEIIIVTRMTNFFSLTDFSPNLSGKNLIFNIVLIKICDSIFMAFIRFSAQRMNRIDCMKNSIVSSIICSLIFLCRQLISNQL